MIIEEIPITNNKRKFVTRICDECGNKNIVRVDQIWKSRFVLKKKFDLCHYCASLPKYRDMRTPQLKELGSNWKGGIIIHHGHRFVYAGTHNYIPEHRIIIEEKIGRKLTPQERVHHIDFDGLNNNVNNLYLFASESDHRRCHAEMELLGFSLLNKKIWFDNLELVYVCHKMPEVKPIVVDLSDIDVNRKYVENHMTHHCGMRLVEKYRLKKSNHWNNRSFHCIVVEKMIGRKLSYDEHVHHIDGNSINNVPKNLCIISKSHHRVCHSSIQKCVAELLKLGVVNFERGKYYAKNF